MHDFDLTCIDSEDELQPAEITAYESANIIAILRFKRKNVSTLVTVVRLVTD